MLMRELNLTDKLCLGDILGIQISREKKISIKSRFSLNWLWPPYRNFKEEECIAKHGGDGRGGCRDREHGTGSMSVCN